MLVRGEQRIRTAHELHASVQMTWGISNPPASSGLSQQSFLSPPLKISLMELQRPKCFIATVGGVKKKKSKKVDLFSAMTQICLQSVPTVEHTLKAAALLSRQLLRRAKGL